MIYGNYRFRNLKHAAKSVFGKANATFRFYNVPFEFVHVPFANGKTNVENW